MKRCSRRALTRPKICAAESMRLSLLVFTQLFSNVARSHPAKPARKQNLTRNSRSLSFEVTHFGTNEKRTTDCISPYNNVGLISKVSEKIASEIVENCRSRQHHYREYLHLMSSLGETPFTFQDELLSRKVESLCYSSVKIS